MRPRTMIILAVMAAVLLILTFATRRAERAGERIDSGPIFPSLTRAAVAGIRLSDGTATVDLRLREGLWRVATEGNQPADTLAVSRILEKLPLLDRRYLRSNAVEMQEKFEVDDAHGIEVAFADARGGELARFRVGKNGPDFRSQYVRPTGSNEVFLVPEYMRTLFDLKRATWRDRSILAFDVEQVARVTFRPADAPAVTVEKNAEGQFAITAPENAPVKTQALEATLRALSGLRCDTFADSLVLPAAAGLDPPRQRVEVQLQDGAALGLDIGAEAPDAGRVYVRRDGAETIFLLGAGRVPTLVRKLEDLREESAAPEGGASGAGATTTG